MSKAKLERLLNLTALLIETERPLTATDVRRRMEGYPDDAVAFRQAFERDKRDLREMGIPLAIETVPGTLPAVEGYRIPKDHYYLGDPGLDPDELAALHLAASVVRLDGSAAEEGLAKLGTFAEDGSVGTATDELGLDIAALPARADLGAIFGAVVDCRPVRFSYRGELRTLDPYRLDFQRGRWYLSGHDHQRAASRIFRLDRIDGRVEVLDGPTFERPTSEVPGGPVDPWQLGGGDPVIARLLVDGSHAPWIVDYLGAEAVVEQRAGGGVVVELPVTNRDSFRSFALTFLDHAEVLDPPELRDDLVAWLEKLQAVGREGGAVDSVDVALTPAPRLSLRAGALDRGESRPARNGTSSEPIVGRRTATDRVLRMLSIVPWIAAHDGPRVDDVCSRFGMTRAQLLGDLNVVQLVGLPPYTPDMLIDVVFEGDRVWVRFAEVFARPLRLTPDQALALVAAGAALVDPAGDDGVEGPLATGLAKLAGLLGIAPTEAIAIRLGLSRPEVLDSLRQAVRERRRVHLDYFAYHRDQTTSRDVDPYRVFAAGGAWYLVGHCHLAGDIRTFRVDRVYGLERLDATFDRPAAGDAELGAHALDLDPDAPRVVLDLAASARWVVETYPVDESAERVDGSTRARVAVASRTWLERLLLRLGPEAEIVETTDPALVGARQAAARRVLARYRG